jgi:tetratricopeptide (TPR) repeat protein
MLAWGLGELLRSKAAFFAVFAIAVLAFSILSFRQTSFWQSNEKLYERALAVTKNNFLISHNLCYALMLEDRLDEAEPLCRAAIEVKPDYYESYNTLGILQIKRGAYPEAEASFKRVLERAPNFTLAYANLSVAQSLLKNPEAAEASLEKAVRANDGKVASDVWINALNSLAATYNEQGKHDKAAENLTRILLIDQNNAAARANLALTFARLKRYDEAQKLIETALQLNPNEAAAFNIYGMIMLEQNRPGEAAGLFERALQLKPDFMEAQENLRKARGEK